MSLVVQDYRLQCQKLLTSPRSYLDVVLCIGQREITPDWLEDENGDDISELVEKPSIETLVSLYFIKEWDRLTSAGAKKVNPLSYFTSSRLITGVKSSVSFFEPSLYPWLLRFVMHRDYKRVLEDKFSTAKQEVAYIDSKICRCITSIYLDRSSLIKDMFYDRINDD
jgi:hypothetical protein